MNFNGLKVGDTVSPHTNDVNNVDYVTTTGKYIVKKLYKSPYGESMDIECVDFGDVYILESPNDFSVVCKHCDK